MGRFVILNALLLGLIGAASGATMASFERPEFPLNAKEGCKPGSKVTAACPVRMECFTDKQFAKGGRCDCNPLWWKVRAKLPFDPDSEWDDGFDQYDCEGHHMSRFIGGMYHLFGVVTSFAFIVTDVMVLKELKRVKALRWNATTYSLIFLLYAAIGVFFVDLIYMFNTWDADKTEYWYTSRVVLFTYCLIPANAIIDFEIGVTWIDLYDRTNKMSKSSSRSLKAMRLALRAVALLMCFGYGIWIQVGGLMGLLLAALMPSISGMIFIAIGGNLIIKTLCPNNKDVANPNWKVASAIRRAVKHGVGAKLLEIIGLLGMGFTARHPTIGNLYGWFNILFFFAYVFRMWGWLHYLIYGSRKHLKKYSQNEASSYFGFSTIGLNKTLTTASSAISTRSSAISSRSSAAQD